MFNRHFIASLSVLLAVFSTTQGVVVNSEGALETAITTANGGGDPLIQLGSSFSISSNLFPLNSNNVFGSVNNTITIDGQGNTLSGGARPFFARGSADTVTIQNLTISGAIGQGGDGGIPRGGGALGAGGSLFLNTGSTVIVRNVTFQNSQAIGGDARPDPDFNESGGGGGGFGGDGGSTSDTGFTGGGGGGGFNGNGGNGSQGAGGGGGFNGNGGGTGGVGAGGGGGGGFNGGNGDDGPGGGSGDGGPGAFGSGSSGVSGGPGSGTGVGGSPTGTGRRGSGAGGVLNTDGADGTGETATKAGNGGSGPGGGGAGNRRDGKDGGDGGDGGQGFGGGGGISDTENPGSGGNGGLAGGGGGSGKTDSTPTSAVSAGNGGDFGGGAGSGQSAGVNAFSVAGDGGFGGGGGGAGMENSVAGAGGFGAGGGGSGVNGQPGGLGGFAGGDGGAADPGNYKGLGGGGAAMGGAIFIQNGAHLIIQDCISFSGSSLTAGTGNQPGERHGIDIFMMSDGLITVENFTCNASVPNPIESDLGAGGGPTGGNGFTMGSGNTGVFTLNGANTYTGTTTVNSGSLYVQGSVITPVVVNGGVFGGNADLLVNGSVPNSGDLTVNGGIVAPGGDLIYGTINVGNDLTIGAGGMLDAEVDSVSNTDSISVVGTATLSGTIEVQAVAGNFLAGQTIPLINAGVGVTGTFDTEIIPFSSGSQPLFQVLYTPTSVELLVLENSVFNPDLTGQTIGKGNPNTTANYLISLLPVDPNSDLGFVIRSLGLVPNSDINKTLNLIHPGSFGLLEWPGNDLMETLSQQLFKRDRFQTTSMEDLAATFTAANGDRPFYPTTPLRRGRKDLGPQTAWLQPIGTWNTQSQKGELIGMNYQTVGALAGYDYTFDDYNVGATAGYNFINFSWHGGTGKGHVNQVQGGVYGSYFNKYFSVFLATMLGKNFYHTNRHIQYRTPGHPGGSLDRTARGSFGGLQWSNHLGLIGDFEPFSVPLQIFGNLDHKYLNISSFHESGADSLNLHVKTKVSNMLRSELGLSTSYTFERGVASWTPYFRLSWVNKTPLSSSTYRANLNGQSKTLSVSTTSKGTNQWSPGFGAEFANGYGFALLANARAELNGKMKNLFIDMNLSYQF